VSDALPLSCPEFLDAAAAYGLGLLDPAEQAACERHLALVAMHPVCLQAAAEARAVAVKLAAGLPMRAPRPEVWTALEARLRQQVAPARAPAAAVVEIVAASAPIGSIDPIDPIQATPPVELVVPARVRVPTPTGCE
jgi:hypothetical protein